MADAEVVDKAGQDAANQVAADDAAAQQAAEAAFKRTVAGEPAPVEERVDVEAEAKAKAEADAAAAAAVKTVEPTAEQKAVAEKARQERETAEEQEWLKGVPVRVRESLSAISQLSGRVRNVEGHIGGLTSAQKELKATLEAAGKAAAAAGGAAPSADQVAAAASSSKKWKQMQEDFPEWAEALEERLGSVKGADAPKIDVEKMRAEIREDVARELNLDRVEEVHPGWQGTVKTPDFAAWLKTQPTDSQALAESVKARDAIKLLDSYSEAKKAKDTKPAETPADDPNKARLEAAVAPTRGKTVTKSEPMTEQQAAEAAFKRIRGAAL